MVTYDEVPYLSKSFRATHPEMLSVCAALAGLETAAPRECRVLEIACAGGGNLLPMAELYPKSEFVGVDISPVQIEQARKLAKAAQIGNAEFHCADIQQFAPAGEFDFIICHGLYSWVPAGVRDRLLDLCRRHLCPRGVTFMSHMVLPGSYIWLALRRAMQATRRGNNPAEIAAAARATAKTLGELSPAMSKHWGQVVAGWSGQLSPLDSILLHDQLGEFYYACYLTEFVDHASRFGLRYLPCFSKNDPKQLHPKVQDSIDRATSDLVAQWQLLDIARFRVYRQSILARSDAPATMPDPAAVVERGHLASPKLLQGSSGMKALGMMVDPALQDQLAVDALTVLAARWPRTMAFAELANRLQMPATGDPDHKLANMLLSLHWKGDLELWLNEPTYIGDGSNPWRARTTRFARVQAASGEWITNLRHMTLEGNVLPPCDVVAALDGTPPTAEMLPDIAWLARNSMLLGE